MIHIKIDNFDLRVKVRLVMDRTFDDPNELHELLQKLQQIQDWYAAVSEPQKTADSHDG